MHTDADRAALADLLRDCEGFAGKMGWLWNGIHWSHGDRPIRTDLSTTTDTDIRLAIGAAMEMLPVSAVEPYVSEGERLWCVSWDDDKIIDGPSLLPLLRDVLCGERGRR